MHKLNRQNFLKKIIGSREAADQQDLLQALNDEGIATTQATISRDLQEMGFVKVRLDSGKYCYRILDKNSREALHAQLEILFRNFVTEVLSANNMIIIKTTPGNANGVARIIDSSKKTGILGTIAGDDTILIITDIESNRLQLENDFRQLLQEIQ